MCNLNGLQRICDTLAEHPTWTLAHLAAHFALYDSFNDERINSHLNTSDSATGISPLQVAVKTGNLKTVQMLVAARCSLEHLDDNGNSVFHYAATTNKDIIAVKFCYCCNFVVVGMFCLFSVFFYRLYLRNHQDV